MTSTTKLDISEDKLNYLSSIGFHLDSTGNDKTVVVEQSKLEYLKILIEFCDNIKSKKAYKILQTTSLFNLLVNVNHFNLQGEALEQFNKAYLKALENTSFERINETFSDKIHYDINDPIFSLIHSIFDRNCRKGRKSDPTWKEDISKGKVRINRKLLGLSLALRAICFLNNITYFEICNVKFDDTLENELDEFFKYNLRNLEKLYLDKINLKSLPVEICNLIIWKN